MFASCEIRFSGSDFCLAFAKALSHTPPPSRSPPPSSPPSPQPLSPPPPRLHRRRVVAGVYKSLLGTRARLTPKICPAQRGGDFPNREKTGQQQQQHRGTNFCATDAHREFLSASASPLPRARSHSTALHACTLHACEPRHRRAHALTSQQHALTHVKSILWFLVSLATGCLPARS